MPNARIYNSVANIGIKSQNPNVRVSSFQTTRSGEGAIAVGTPIGLLLLLTYSDPSQIGAYGDFRPNAWIR